MIVTLAFKKKETSPTLIDNLIDNTIKWWTKSEYFHVETIIGNKWISSSPEVGAVYIRPLKKLNDNYDYIDIDIKTPDVYKMLIFAENQVGKKYDWLGIIFSQTINLSIDNKNKWFCSEIMAEMLKIAGEPLEKKSNEYSPGDLFRIYSKKYKVRKIV